MALKNRFERIARGQGARPLGFQALGEGTEDIRFLSVDPAQIERDPTQPRKDLGALDGLRASIKDQGILQPLIVAPLDDQRFRLIAGERRLTAARQLGLAAVPVIVRSVEEQKRLILQIVENLHRKDLSPLEEAEGVQRLVEAFGLSQRDAAARLGKSLTYINELLRILRLPSVVLAAVRTSEHPISKSLLLEIAKQPGEARQRQLWRQASTRAGLTVQAARRHKQAVKPSSRPRAEGTVAAEPSRTAPPAHGQGAEAGWSLSTELGVVSVQLRGGDPRDPTRIRQALDQALRSFGS